jgi:hypothetical protein
VPERQPAFGRLEAGGPVLGVHQPQRALEYPSEIPDPVIVPAKLRLERRPRDEGRLAGIDPVKSLRQPGGMRRMRKPGTGCCPTLPRSRRQKNRIPRMSVIACLEYRPCVWFPCRRRNTGPGV